MFSPKLVKIYGNGPVERYYEPQLLEKTKLGVYSSPFLVGILYQKGYLEGQGLISLTKLVTGVGSPTV